MFEAQKMKRRYHLHAPGLLYVILVLLVGLAAVNGQNNLLFWVFGVMFSALIVSGLISGAMMLGVRVRRLDPRHGLVGEPLIVRYEITNRNRLLPIFNIHIEERPSSGGGAWQRLMKPCRAWIMHIGPDETVHGEAVFWPTRRGEARFDGIRIWTTFPFGIVKKSVTHLQPQHTLIYPQLYELRDETLRAVELPSPVGTRITPRSGSGDDYYGMREYRHNDSVRNIAWKRSAHQDELVCIERSMPSPPRLRVVLNLTRPTSELRVGASERWTARELEERSISLTASILHLADLHGYEIGLFVPGTDLPPYAVRRNHWHVRKLMAALAGIDLEAPRRADSVIPTGDLERVALIVIGPDRVDPAGQRSDVLYLTARQLESLAIGPIGWDPARRGSRARDMSRAGRAERREVAA